MALRGSMLLFLITGCAVVGGGLVPGARAQAAEDALWQRYRAAQASIRNGDRERADAEYRSFLGEALHLTANARAQAGDLDVAARWLEDALALAPDPAIRLDYASVLFDANRLREARPAAQAVVHAEPRNARARVLLGRICFAQKDYVAAKDQFEAAVAQGEMDGVWRWLSLTYLRLQQLGSARSLLQATLAHLGDTPTNRVTVATVYYYGDYPDEAIEELRKVIAEDNTAPDAHYYLGLAYLARNEEEGYAQAIPEFRAQLRIQPKNFPSRYMLGYIALKQRDFAEAQRQLEDASTLSPHDAGTQLLLGQLYSETDRDPLAQEVLLKLIASWDENNPNATLVRAHYILGRTLQHSGKLEEGAKEIRESEQLRRQMRLGTSAVSESAGVRDGGELSGQPAQRSAAEADKERARAFIRQMSPHIAEGYFNLGGIAAHRGDAAAAAQFRQKAAAWDPSLSQGQRQ